MRVKEDSYPGGKANCAAPSQCPVLWEKWCRGCNLVYCGKHADPKEHACRSLAEVVPAPAKVSPPTPPETDNPTACVYCGKPDNSKNGPTQDLDCEACGGHHRVCKRECLKRESKATGTFPKFKTKLRKCPQ